MDSLSDEHAGVGLWEKLRDQQLRATHATCRVIRLSVREQDGLGGETQPGIPGKKTPLQQVR